jgi:hypothetical protein
MDMVNQDINIRTEKKVKKIHLAYIIDIEEWSNVQFITYNGAIYIIFADHVEMLGHAAGSAVG